MTASRIATAALLLSFGALAIFPTIDTASARETVTPSANSTSSLAHNDRIGKQTAGSQDHNKSNLNDSDKKNNNNTLNSDHSLREYSIILPFPISNDDNKKTQTSHDHSINDESKSNANLDKNNNNNKNNDNKDPKLKDTIKGTPLLLPFP